MRVTGRRVGDDRRWTSFADDGRVDDARFGRAIRIIRTRARLRLADLAARAGLSQAAISDVERGHGHRLSVATLRAVARALDADAGLELRWRGGDVDRLLDGRHAVLVGLAVDLLIRDGWEVATEVTYSRYGERGSFDVLAIWRRNGTVLTIEVKTRLVSLEATLRKLDEKARLAPAVAAERFDMRPQAAGRILVLPEGSVSRRALVTHDAVLRVALPVRGVAARAWLADPASSIGGIVLVRVPTGAPGPETPRRVSPRGLADKSSPRASPTVTLGTRRADPRISPPVMRGDGDDTAQSSR